MLSPFNYITEVCDKKGILHIGAFEEEEKIGYYESNHKRHNIMSYSLERNI